MRKLTVCASLLFFLSVLSYADQRSAVPDDGGFSIAIAERQLSEFRDGLLAQNPRQALAGFDRTRPEYSRLSRALALLFDRYQSMRVFYTVRQASTGQEGSRSVALVEFTIEAAPYDQMQPPVRRTAELHFEFANTGGKWKIVKLEPLAYFESF